VGIKDDITVSHPRIKLLGQILSVIYVSVLADIRVSNLHEFLNIGDIPYLLSIVLTILVLVVIINGFNLIDGIDGLASGVGILISSILGLWFYLTNNFTYTVMSFSLAGTLLAFFYFNVFSKKQKIFLGDTGSLLIGLILGVMMVRFLQPEPSVKGLAVIKSTPAVAISLFIIPLFDTLQVFTTRVVQGKSPFKADRQHIHHRLLELGFNHLQSTVILLSLNLVFFIICYLLQDFGTIFLIIIQLVISILLLRILILKAKKRNIKVID
jgi:UDP-N-acetylmuramyl pentapeptide phosphotransferase/UDP-N-acetylglucosamine-1-phosphate transferase